MKTETFELLNLAIEAHDGQYRRGGVIPYITHPVSVARILASYGHNSHRALGTAFCHDLVEDCEEKFHIRLKNADPTVFRMVCALTNSGTFERTCQGLQRADYITQLVKCADIKHNTISKGCDDLKWLAKYRKKKLVQLTFLDKIRGERLWKDTVEQCQGDPLHDG